MTDLVAIADSLLLLVGLLGFCRRAEQLLGLLVGDAVLRLAGGRIKYQAGDLLRSIGHQQHSEFKLHHDFGCNRQRESKCEKRLFM